MFTTSHVFVSMDKALNDEIHLAGGIKLYLDPRWNKEWNATVNGKIEALPKEGYKGLKTGDDIAFSYKVVSERSYPADGHHFFPHIDTENVKEFINGKGERIRVLGFMGPISRKWVASYSDRSLQLIDGVQGQESDLSRWLSQFSFGDVKTYTFKNLTEVDGKDLWIAKLEHLIAKKEGDRITMLCDKLLCTPIDIPITEIKNGVYIPNQTARLSDSGRVVCGNEEIGVKEGDVVAFDERYREKYRLWDNDYYLLKPTRIFGLWQDK